MSGQAAANRYRAKQKANGRCIVCGRPRGKNGTTTVCEEHRLQRNHVEKQRHQRNKCWEMLQKLKNGRTV